VAIFRTLRNIRTLYGKDPPREVFFAITNACNISCKTCTFGKLPKADRTFVEIEHLTAVLDHLKVNGVRMVSITGGEPLLHPQFLEICEQIDARGMMVSYIATNGTLLNERIARGLSALNINIVGLSVDVVDAKGRGITRGLNIDKVVPKARRLLEKYGIKSYAGIVLGKHTMDIARLMRKVRSWGFSKVIFSYPQVHMGSTYRAAEECEFTRITVEDARTLIKDIEVEKKGNFSVSIFNTRVNLEEFLRAQSGKDWSFPCPGGANQFYLDWNYDLFRCFNDGKRLGNLVEMADSNSPLRFRLGKCRGCTQEAFLDYGSFYHAFNVVRDGIDSLKRMDIGKALVLLKNRENRRALASLFEAYLGGFV
jgi:MoaA/NifB/PqqE/SkfB family radical SAM enzyme